METHASSPASRSSKRRFDWLHVVLLVLVAILLTAGVTFWAVKTYIFPSEFTPVRLSATEERALDAKLEDLESLASRGPAARREPRRSRPASPATGTAEPLEPEPYSEAGAKREIALSEREINALLAKNTDLARKLAIDLSGDLVSAKLLLPVDEDFPILGGRILKVRAGVELAYRAGKPVVVLKGISVMGVPLPNAWLGGIKNIDLVEEYGGQAGFWRSFSEGIEDVHVEEGRLVMRLKE